MTEKLLTGLLGIITNKTFLVGGKFCCLLITFANSLDPDLDWQNVCPDMGPNGLTL